MKKIFSLNNAITTLILILNVLFVAYYGILIVNSAYHFDDFNFLAMLRDMSPLEFTKEMYYEWCGRYTGVFIEGVTYKLIYLIGDHFVYLFLVYVLTVLLLGYALKPFITKLNKLQFWNVVLLISNLYVLTNCDFSIFTWICASSYYLSMPLFLVLLRLLLENKLSRIQYIFMCVIAFYLGGASETFVPAMLMVMFIYGIYLLYKDGWSFADGIKDKKMQRLLIVTGIILVAFAILLLAPGNYTRNTGEISERSIGGTIFGSIKVFAAFIYLQSFYFPYYLVLIGLFALIGNNSNITHKKALLYSLIACGLAFVCIFSISLCLGFLYGAFEMQRVMTPAVLTLILLCCYIGYLIGASFHCNIQKGASIMSIICTCFLIVVMSLNIILDTPKAMKYRKQFVERDKLILDEIQKGRTDTLVLKSVVSPATLDAKWVILHMLGKKHNDNTRIYYGCDDEYNSFGNFKNAEKYYKSPFHFVLEEQ